MTTTTPNLGLTLWNDTTDITALFKDFRLGLTGPTSSNMTIIDTYYGNLSTLVNNTKGSFYLAGTGTNNYTASNTYITAYFSGLSIILYVNNSNTGASDLTINALGAKNLMKINSSGSVVALSAGDLILNTKYLFVYDGTQFILVGGISADQIASLIHSATSKVTLVDNDEIGLSDSEASYGLKKILWSNLKTNISSALSSVFQSLSGKDATGGYVGLTLFKINFKNAANTFTSFFTNSNTAARTYTFQNRDGIIADDTDIAGRAPSSEGVTNGNSHDHIGGDGAAITESAITLVDNTTNDASTTKHGFMSKYPNSTGKYLFPGYIKSNSAQLLYVGTAAYSVLPGDANVNGTLLSWSSNIARTSLSLSANTIYYVYLYNSSGATVEESTTIPVWSSTLEYYQKTGDATRRCIGWIETNGSSQIRKFICTAYERTCEIIYADGDAAANKEVVSAGATTGSWASFSLAPFIPSHATDWFCAPKLIFAATTDDTILGLSPWDLSTATGGDAPYTVRAQTSIAAARVFFGRIWLPISTAQTYYYRLNRLAGTGTTNIEAHGARIVR